MTTELNIRVAELRKLIDEFEGSKEDLALLLEELRELEAQQVLVRSMKKN